VPLAAPGPELVPGAIEAGPDWLLGIYGEGLGIGGGAYLALLGVGFAAYLGVLACARSLPPRLLAAAIAALVLAFALAPPLLSQDVFSYIAYDRLHAEHGLDPYQVAPDAVPGDPVFAHVGWRDTVSAYGPLFTLAGYPLGLIGVPAALWSYKALAAISVLALAGLTARVARRRGLDPAGAAALVALNPLVLVHVVGGAHNDGLMMLAAMAGVAAILAAREAAGGAALVAGAGVKAASAFLAPFALLGAERRLRLAAGAALAAAGLIAAALLAYGADAVGSLGLVGENQAATSHYSVPATLSRVVGADVDALRVVALIAFALVVVWLLARTARGADWVTSAGWAALALLLTTGWLLPWYLIWALPLAAISRSAPLVASVLALTAFQLVNRIPL
jgi:hypothetical protein